MITLKTEYPYIERNGFANYKMIKYYAEDEKGFRYKVENQQTHKILDEAICLYPCNFTYKALERKCEKQSSILIEEEKSDKKRQPKKERIEIEVKVEPIVEMVEEEPKTIDEAEAEEEIAIEEKETALEETAEELGEENENKDEEGERNNELYKED